jgi:hypothetical protein
MDWTCNMYGICELCIQKFGRITRSEGRSWEIYAKWGISVVIDLRKIRYDNVDRIKLASNRF